MYHQTAGNNDRLVCHRYMLKNLIYSLGNGVNTVDPHEGALGVNKQLLNAALSQRLLSKNDVIIPNCLRPQISLWSVTEKPGDRSSIISQES